MARRLTAVLVVLLFGVAACGSDSVTVTGADDSSAPADGDGGAAAEEPAPAEEEPAPAEEEPAADDGSGADAGIDGLVENLEDQQAAQGGGAATLQVGDQTWTFDSVLCAFGEDEIGQEGAEFVLSSIQDGLQMYVSVDSFGHSVSLNDIEDFENPSVALSADPFSARLAGADEEFVVVDGKSVSADTLFFDTNADDLEGTPGTFSATCP